MWLWRRREVATALIRRAFSSSAPPHSPGLFGIDGLHNPKDFIKRMHDTRTRSNEILQKVLHSDPTAGIVRLMDDLSDELCQTYDAAECCRNVHPDPAWHKAATQVCMELGEFISHVNHDTGLYTKLSTAIQRYQQYQQYQSQHSQVATDTSASTRAGNSTVASAGHWAAKITQHRQHPLLSAVEAAEFDSETVLVGSKLLMDMEKAGIHLEDEPRQRMQKLMNLNQHYGAIFNAALNDPLKLGTVTINTSPKALPTGSIFTRLRSQQQSSFKMPLDAANTSHVLLTEPDETVRKQVLLAANMVPKSNLVLMDEIISTRREMAQAVGCSSFSEYKAIDASLAQEPQAIVGFLEHVASSIRPAADAELQVLRKVKRSYSQSGDSQGVFAWDTEFLMARARSDACSLMAPQALSEYLNLGSVFEGYEKLMKAVFGLKVTVVPAPAAESWAPGILKMSAEHPDLGPLGTVYLDLCSRPSKYPGAVTFPIRCGRSLESPSCTSGGAGRYQLPIMALLADFGPGDPLRVALSYRELRTLLHELGHCFHNLASRTRYQHLWGTRCAQDMVEVPSHLWEHFAVDPVTLCMLARHKGSTRDPLPAAVAQQLVEARRLFSALELQGQALLALVDQHYFGPADAAASMAQAEAALCTGALPRDTPATSHIWSHVARQYSSVPHPLGTHPQARVGHFTVYGASYYSYVYARFISAAVWNKHLQGCPLDRSSGAAIWDGLLRPGGSVEPVDLMSRLMGQEALQQSTSGGWAPRPDDAAILRARDSF